MRLSRLAIVIVPVLLTSLAACKPKEATPPAAAAATAGKPAMSETDKTLYALGSIISRNLDSFALTAAELEVVKRGMSDGVTGKPSEVPLDQYGPKVDELHRTRLAAVSAKEAQVGQAYLLKAAAEPGAKKTASGLVITEVKAGTGPVPKATDTVKVNYTGTLIDGKVFDSSVQRGEPATFPLNGVIPCWTEALQLMKVGGKSKVVCPAAIAYGERGAPPAIKPGATLTFDVELLAIVK